ncbi:helix-turn-helix domain-containing protein [Hamadaea tsunoensis]|uniref:helix-turn-helix domain-containing protein n=1 Tax=Hamadaea tsunoensis TaxID=53368 RepID=UPI0004134821|nr:helix-turn-helix transcriptional regulator [Hamadaea tsunoensis]
MGDTEGHGSEATRRELAALLRQQREQAELSTDQLAGRLRITAAEIAAVEGGDQPIPGRLVYGWLNACGLLGPERRAIMDLAE